MQNNMEDNIWPNNGLTLICPQRSRQTVITGFRHNLDDHKNENGVATDLFCMGMIGHPRHMFLN